MKHLLYILILLILTLAPVGRVYAEVTTADGRVLTEVQLDSLRQTEDFVKASLVVAEPGGALYSIFGHACLHLVCETFGLDYVFSFESEDAANKMFTFLAGNLRMGMAAVTFDEYVSNYAQEGRSIKEYPLNLSPKTKQNLWQALDEQVEKGMYLPYDYEARGCAYTCSQFVTKALKPIKIQYAPWTKKQMRTRREMCNDFAKQDYPWNMWFIMSIVGTEVDKEMNPANKLIIPTELVDAWQTAAIGGKPLLGEERIVSPSSKQKAKTWFTPVMAACLVLLLVVLGWIFKKPYADWLIMIIVTLFGALLTFLVPISDLPCSNWNWLLIPFNLLIPIAWHWRRYWALPYAIGLGIWLTIMIAWPHTLVATANEILVVAEILVLIKGWWSTQIASRTNY